MVDIPQTSRHPFKVLWRLALLTMLAFPAGVSGQGDAAISEAMRVEVELLQRSGQLGFENITALEPDTVASIYLANQFSRLWTDNSRIAGLVRAIRASEYDGLTPADYRLELIETAIRSRDEGRSTAANETAMFDLLLTDSLSRLYHDLRFGRLDHSSVTGTRRSPPDGTDAAVVVPRLAESASLTLSLASELARNPEYQNLRTALQAYRQIATDGGWPGVAEGSTLETGRADPRLAVLVQRLLATGDLDSRPETIDEYDANLQAAVRRFQSRHGLQPDGLVGPATLRAMNVPVEDRVDQIRVNLERLRRASLTGQGHTVLVNIAAFELGLYRNGVITWTTRIVAGERETETPELQSAVEYVVLNPTWTVPRSIAAEELLETIQQDSWFLSRGGYDVVDAAGRLVDPAGIDWQQLSPQNFPFTLVQRAGPVNELGQIKFMFPNEFGVSVHDTPNRHLFETAARHFSHGCIRVDEPLELAARLLDSQGWTRERLDEELATGETQTVFLADPVPILVVYRTAIVNAAGWISFYPDIYERDAAVLAAIGPDRRTP